MIAHSRKPARTASHNDETFLQRGRVMKIEAHRKILFLAIVLVLLSPLPAYAACGDGSFETSKLIAGTSTSREFGRSVAVSGDTIVVGDPDEAAAYVFEYEEGKWNPKARLTDGNGFSWFGWSVAISGDTVAVGAPLLSSVYLFKRVGDSWNEDPDSILMASDSAFSFGWALAFEGSTLVVGAAIANSAYVLNMDGTNGPEEEAKLTVLDSEKFGWSVAVSGDRVLVGAPWDNLVVQDPDDPDGTITIQSAGSAYVFEFDGNSWLGKEPTELKREDAAEDDLFGFSVAIHDNTAVVGAHKDNSKNVSNPGAVYVFEFDGVGWLDKEPQLIIPSDSADYDEFGYSVAIKDSILLVGAPLYVDPDPDYGPNGPGAAYVFKPDGESWSEEAKLTASDAGDPPEKDQFGLAVAINETTLVVGAILADVEIEDVGAAYVFTPNEASVSEVYSTLGSSRHRFFPAWEIFEFTAAQGDKATLIFEADPNGNNNHGKGVSVFVKDKIRGERFFMKNRWALGTPMEMDLPADGEYRVFVFGHPCFFKNKGFRGDYVLNLKVEGTCAELRKVSRRKKCK